MILSDTTLSDMTLSDKSKQICLQFGSFRLHSVKFHHLPDILAISTAFWNLMGIFQSGNEGLDGGPGIH